MPAPAPGGLYRVYAGLTALTAGLVAARVRGRMRADGISDTRIAERMGEATEARPGGPLLWFHAVSVGEAVSILGLVTEMGRRRPDLNFLITSVSATSARLVGERLPARTRHQYAPLDTPAPVRRFLDHWRPDLAVFVESELWPRQIVETDARGVALALINARLSERSLTRWRRMGGLIRALLARFSVIVSQTDSTARALAALGADPARISVSGDLKAASERLPIDLSALETIEAQIGKRPLWVAASTHPGEEELVATAHDPDRLLILAPRHPDRGDGIAAMLRARGWIVAQRSKGEILAPETGIYLADTLGELGLWYALAPVVFLGGSLTEVGGHNPFEPAQFSAAVLTGPHVTNFRQTYDEMIAAGAARMVRDPDALRDALAALDDPGTLHAAQRAAHDFVASRTAIRDHVADRLEALLDKAE